MLPENPTPPPPVKSWTDSIILKVVVIGITILLLMIPSVMIKELVRERSTRMQTVVQEVSSKWGQMQTIAGPYISIPYFAEIKNGDKVEWKEKALHYFPTMLHVDGSLDPIVRKRSIFKVMLYQSSLVISGHFDAPDLAMFHINPENVHLENATIHLGISDLIGIGQQVKVRIGDTLVAMTASSPTAIRFPNGLIGRLASSMMGKEGFDFSIELSLKGSQGLYITPVANKTTVHLTSPWPSPKFEGQFLPDSSRTINPGFEAHWTILDINRQLSQQWTDDMEQTLTSATGFNTSGMYYDTQGSSHGSLLGVELLDTVDHYTKTDRTVKYAFLLIALTFMVYFFFEMLEKQKVHSLQYGLIGAAVVIFFILLLSLAEHLGFDIAFMISSLATTLLITLYSRSIFTEKRFATFVGGLILLQFGFIYIILQLEDFALLAGSIALFSIIATIMYLTRKVKWS